MATIKMQCVSRSPFRAGRFFLLYNYQLSGNHPQALRCQKVNNNDYFFRTIF